MEDVVEHRYGADELRLVTASFRTHHFVPHAHSDYAIAAVERGVEAVRYRGATEYAPACSCSTPTPSTPAAPRSPKAGTTACTTCPRQS
ncbi:MAG TPA: AraC family ligand binding domain-containing protein [Amycolatopsis sp.]|nr:AraC family ligand binding domain-containing protein [Amycolatopsis sp.]HVV07703.1 AraC family ligand binding domain-containing protein [Amycolatopsis sp.]